MLLILKKKKYINTTYKHFGRLGNLFFVGMALHFIAKKNNLKCHYKMYNKFKNLSIKLFSGENIYLETILLTDINFYNILINEPLYKNVYINNNIWCQTFEFALYLRNYFNIDEQKNKIIENNIYKNNYNNNNNVFIHIRIGDIENISQPFEYYNTILSNLNFDIGYISSDTINHNKCKQLINKYNLIIINYDDIETIMFGSTCKYIILSNGTYSWLIGLLSFYSQVYYPKYDSIWHKNIYRFNDWLEVNYNNIN